MNLIIDIGNTRAKLAVFEDDNIIDKTVVSFISKSVLEDIYKKFDIDKIILSTVKPVIEDVIINTIDNWNKLFIRLSYKTVLPIKNDYKTPKTLGQDRIASVVGATYFFQMNIV
ncbi:MAG: type III pantothenate kinase [Saprospiraceae bacterium]|nr:type III pantothenate kinase [Saprospiraceae bacterium]